MAHQASAHCSTCLVGAMVPTKAFYCQWADGHFITVPDFPAWVCDVCGTREYEPQAVLELQTLIEMSHPAPGHATRRAAAGRDETPEQMPAPPRRHP